MIKICAPFKNCKLTNLTQGFHKDHQANDFASSYGTFLVAPFNAKVANVTGAETFDGKDDLLRNGCGVRLVSVEDPSISISYWHCQPVFPVSKGDTVLQGKIVAMMGNTGWVQQGPNLVPIDIRLIPPYPGTHVHISMGQQIPGGMYAALDMSKLIDFNIPININWIEAISVILQKMIQLLKGH